MKKTKLIMSLMLVLILSISLCACGDKNDENGDSESKSNTASSLPKDIDKDTLKKNYEALEALDDKFDKTPDEIAEVLGVQGTLNKERTDSWNDGADEGKEYKVVDYPNDSSDAGVRVLFKKLEGEDFKVSSFSPTGLD